MKTTIKQAVFSCLLLASAGVFAPSSAFAFDIKGATAEAWVTAGDAEGIAVTLTAIPANQTAVQYAGSGADPIFDAPDRDTLSRGIRGIGVDNTLIASGNPGVTSKPSEIGYYRNTAICGVGKVLGENCGDELRVGLDTAVYGGSVEVSFFYGSEEAGETLVVQLYKDGTLVYDSKKGPANNGSYNNPANNPGLFTFELGDYCWDEIRFLGDNAIVNDASDYLVEGISTLTVCTVTVNINVHPNSDPNPLNLYSGGTTPVAIFGSADFDVTLIDLSTLRFGDSAVKVVGKADRSLCSYEDIGSYNPTMFDKLGGPDGYTDLVCHFVTADIGDLEAGEGITITVMGELTDGTDFEGSDVVKVVK